MSRLAMRVRFFLSRRSRGRKGLAIFLFAVAVLAVVFPIIPVDVRSQALDAVGAIPQWLPGVQPQLLVGIAAGLLALVGIMLLVLPGYRKHPYLTTSPSLIPPVSVYVDAENQLGDEVSIPAFRKFLMGRLGTRRTDLLLFLDANTLKEPESRKRYDLFYRTGFRLVDVPHNQAGAGSVKEAVDREISLHAFERALLGPANQEFIIVSGDGDYVPLVYRLIALGHKVQIWAASVPLPYYRLNKYLDFEIVPLPEIGNQSAARSSKTPAQTWPQMQSEINAALLQEQLGRAVHETIQAYMTCQGGTGSDHDKEVAFKKAVQAGAHTFMSGLGYNVGNWPKHWIDWLILLQVFQRLPDAEFPVLGPRSSDVTVAATALLSMADMAAQAAAIVIPRRKDGIVSAYEVASLLAVSVPDTDRANEAAFWQLIDSNRTKAALYVRYSLYMARALHLLNFEGVQSSKDLIKNPRLVRQRPSKDHAASQASEIHSAEGTESETQ